MTKTYVQNMESHHSRRDPRGIQKPDIHLKGCNEHGLTINPFKWKHRTKMRKHRHHVNPLTSWYGMRLGDPEHISVNDRKQFISYLPMLMGNEASVASGKTYGRK